MNSATLLAHNVALGRCSPKLPVADRALISTPDADELAELFKVLANGSRLRLLHALVRAEELCVTGLADAVEMSPQAVSNQLQRLTDRGIVASRREGTNIFYRIVDPCVVALLDQGLCLAEDNRERQR